MIRTSGTEKSNLILDWLVFGTFQPEFDKFYYSYQHYPSLHGLSSKNIKNIEFFHRNLNYLVTENSHSIKAPSQHIEYCLLRATSECPPLDTTGQ